MGPSTNAYAALWPCIAMASAEDSMSSGSIARFSFSGHSPPLHTNACHFLPTFSPLCRSRDRLSTHDLQPAIRVAHRTWRPSSRVPQESGKRLPSSQPVTSPLCLAIGTNNRSKNWGHVSSRGQRQVTPEMLPKEKPVRSLGSGPLIGKRS